MTQFRSQLIRLIDDALGDDPKAALIAARDLSGEVDWLAKKAVALARVNGYDWGRIGRLLDLTRHGARKKFAVISPTPSPVTRRTERYLKPQRDAERMLARFDAGLPIIDQEPDDPVFW